MRTRRLAVAVSAVLATIAIGALTVAAKEGAGSISGRITTDAAGSPDDARHLDGVVLTLHAAPSGTVVASALTGNGGKYHFKTIAAGEYTVTPDKLGYVFAPGTRSVNVADDHVKGQDFIAMQAHRIAGRVTTNHGGATAKLPLHGVTVTLGGAASATATTDADGRYSFDTLAPGSYTVTPHGFGAVLPGIPIPSGADTSGMFSPASRTVLVNVSDVTGLDFNGFNACAAISGCVDSDGDGLCDAWEIAGGIDFDGDGIIDPVNDLLLPGADPQRKDLYLEIDYMVAADHGHRPRPEAIQAVVDAFARHGITVHVDPVHDAIPETRVVTFQSLDPACAGPSASSIYDLKARYSDPKRRSAYHYVVFGHYNTCDSPIGCAACPPFIGSQVPFGSGGLAELPGNDLIVSLGYIFDLGFTPTLEQEAGVLMHELGHNLGLRHGGDQDEPDYKPNFLSVINNNFTYVGIPVAQEPGSVVPKSCAIPADCPGGICTSAGTCARIDYSAVALPTLDEVHLDEHVGITAGTTDITAFVCPDLTSGIGAGAGGIDWNCDGDATDLAVAGDLTGESVLSPLTGHADWPNLNFRFQCSSLGSANAAAPGRLAVEPAISVEQARDRGVLFARRAVRIAIEPGSPAAARTISMSASGVVTVAVFGAEGFDVGAVDRTSVRFAGAVPLHIETSDVDADGHDDLVLFFDARSLKLRGGVRRVTLSGALQNSQGFIGEAQIVVGP
jgi:hypothetical protein